MSASTLRLMSSSISRYRWKDVLVSVCPVRDAMRAGSCVSFVYFFSNKAAK